MGFRYFSLTPDTAAKLLLAPKLRSTPVFTTLRYAIRFLGGFNGTLFVLSASALLLRKSVFRRNNDRALLVGALGVGHFSQLYYNLPVVARNGRQADGGLWNVLSGPMLFIFVVDLLNAVINLGAAAVCFTEGEPEGEKNGGKAK
jgi:hypothetical protein